MTFSALFLGIALVLPFLTGQIPEIGAMLCPMHIPALLCGFVCGWGWGLAVGFIAPLLRSVLFGMPTLYPTAAAMAFELAAYGCLSGVLYRIIPRVTGRLYVILIVSMLGGRVVWGIAEYFMLIFTESPFTLELFISGAVIKAVPGIILQLIIIPPLVKLTEASGLMLN